jgi:hypothetical protein
MVCARKNAFVRIASGALGTSRAVGPGGGVTQFFVAVSILWQGRQVRFHSLSIEY